jgi:hypothetical protein
MNADMIELLNSLLEYFEPRMDADCDASGYIPNEEMRLYQRIEEAIGRMPK